MEKKLEIPDEVLDWFVKHGYPSSLELARALRDCRRRVWAIESQLQGCIKSLAAEVEAHERPDK